MKNKECKICGVEKLLIDFYYRKDSGRYRTECKECYNERNKKQKKEYNEENKEKIKEYHAQYYIENKEIINKKNKKWQKDNKKIVNENKKEWRKNNKEKVKQYLKRWKENNEAYFKRPEFKEKERIRNCKRREDPIFRLNQNISRNMNHSLRNNNLSKNGRSWEYLVGYTTQDLKKHIEKQFQPGMSWDNYGDWHIDHRIPRSFFVYTSVNDVEFKYCWGLGNLQPLWAFDNLSKADKIERYK